MPDLFTDLAGGLPVVGGIVDTIVAADERQADREFQKEMAQHGVRWRVEDAKAAGIHPLAALGTQPFQGIPSAVGDTDFRSLGQDVSRAVQAGTTEQERQQVRMNELQIKRGELENLLLLDKVAKSQSDQVPPAKPGIVIQPSKPVVSGAEGNYELGIHPEVTYGRQNFLGTPGVRAFPSEKFQDYLSESLINSIAFELRNNWLPSQLVPPADVVKQFPGRVPDDFEFLPGIGWMIKPGH